jgi:hypothetical protein
MDLSRLARQGENGKKSKFSPTLPIKTSTAEHAHQDEAGWQVVELK